MTVSDKIQEGDNNRRPNQELSRLEFLRLGGIAVGVAATPSFLASCNAFLGGGGESSILSVAATTEEREPIEAMIEAYKKQNADVEFSTTFVEVDQLHTQLQTELSSGTAPNVFRVAPGSGAPTAAQQVASQGYIADLSDQPWVEKVPKEIQPLVQVDGKTYILPSTRAVIGTYYNKQVFQDLNLEIPQTWNEFLSTCEAIKGAGKIPYALGIQTQFVTQFLPYTLVASAVFSDNPNFAEQMQAGRTSFTDSEGWKDALEKTLELNARGYYNSDPNGTSFEQSLQMVATGEAAMINLVSSILPLLVSFSEGAEFGVFATPGASDPSKVWIPASPIDTFGVNAESANLDAARAFIEFMGEPENVNEFASVAGSLPGLATIEQADIGSGLEVMVPYLEEGKSTPFMNHLWPNAEVQQVFYALVQQLFLGQTTIEDGLNRMDEAYQKG